MNIAIATPPDAAALNQLVNSAYRGDSSRQGWTTEANILEGIRTTEEGLVDMMQEPGAVILKYTGDDGQLDGCVYLQKQDDLLYLGMLTVSPVLQGKGTGKLLLQAAEAHGRENGCRAITMTVISVREELIAWYQRHGYRATGETRPFPTEEKFGIPLQPLEFIVLEKTI